MTWFAHIAEKHTKPEDYDEDEREEECGTCGKKYYLHQSFVVENWTRPDCELNGEKHDYQPRNLRDGKTHPFCDTCGKCQPLSEGEEL